jgi:GNAT superfamily N-acetyltransferase
MSAEHRVRRLYAPDVTVRSLSPADFDSVTALLVALGRPQLTEETAPTAREVFERQLEEEGSDHLVAVDDSEGVVGFCSLHYRTRLNHATLQAWVPDLIVAEEARSTGVGRALLAEAERRARERGCHDLVLESAYFRTRAHAFYEREGMKDAGKTFWKSLI